MQDTITMSKKELFRYEIIRKLINKEIKEKDAEDLIKLSIRQIRRLKKETLNFGPKGLIHKNRGKPSHNKISEKEEAKIKKIITQTLL